MYIHRSATPEDVLTEADTKLKEIQQTKWKSIAKELHGEDPHQFLRVYSPGKLGQYLFPLTNSQTHILPLRKSCQTYPHHIPFVLGSIEI